MPYARRLTALRTDRMHVNEVIRGAKNILSHPAASEHFGASLDALQAVVGGLHYPKINNAGVVELAPFARTSESTPIVPYVNGKTYFAGDSLLALSPMQYERAATTLGKLGLSQEAIPQQLEMIQQALRRQHRQMSETMGQPAIMAPKAARFELSGGGAGTIRGWAYGRPFIGLDRVRNLSNPLDHNSVIIHEAVHVFQVTQQPIILVDNNSLRSRKFQCELRAWHVGAHAAAAAMKMNNTDRPTYSQQLDLAITDARVAHNSDEEPYAYSPELENTVHETVTHWVRDDFTLDWGEVIENLPPLPDDVLAPFD